MPHMNVKEYMSKMKPKNSELKDDMKTCREIDTGVKRKHIPDEGCKDIVERSVELKRPFVFMSASEYEASFNKAPPKPSKCSNTILFPCEDEENEETLWYFKHDASSDREVRRLGLRTGHLVTKRTISHSVKHLPVLSLAVKKKEIKPGWPRKSQEGQGSGARSKEGQSMAREGATTGLARPHKAL